MQVSSLSFLIPPIPFVFLHFSYPKNNPNPQSNTSLHRRGEISPPTRCQKINTTILPIPRTPECLLCLRLDKTVNDRVKEYTSNTNGTSKKLHGIKRLSKDKGNTNNNDDTLGSIGYRLSYGTLLFIVEHIICQDIG